MTVIYYLALVIGMAILLNAAYVLIPEALIVLRDLIGEDNET